MKRTFSILIIFLLLSCANDKKDKKSIPESKVIEKKIEPKIQHNPIFLNLSPRMDYKEYNSKIGLNKELKKGKLTLLLDKKETEFKVHKNKDRITLKFNNVKEISVNELNESYSKYYLKENEKMLSDFLKIFEENYGKSLSILPFRKNRNGAYFNNIHYKENIGGIKNKNLIDYGFEKINYLVFRDSVKVVFVGYDKNGKIVLSGDELMKIVENGKNRKTIKKSNSEKSLKEQLLEYEKSGESEKKELSNRFFGNTTSEKFGLDLEINYYHKEDFENLVKEMKKDKINFENAERRYDSIKKNEKENLIENKRKI